jgi:hypothetical protein
MSKKLALVFGLSFILLYSCSKYSCQRSIGLRLAFVSFTEAETDTVILKRYVKGSNFNQQIDTALIDTSLVKYASRGDTLFPSELHTQTLLINLYDYQVVVPAANKVFTVTDIEEEEKKVKRGFFSSTRDACYNPIRAYTLNGVRKTVIPNREVVYLDN